ncbi:hypothetical protein A3A70_00115 [candidate division WWE3 bacterium RIFCSPLOWO2_01_FULL_42_11]|uniref:UPF0102 protein A3A70_00115 n=1 Tax=candidate division WWE3 bacterium RIFCSPLOWO2_01_FULL_42_11 TaxID=1802627 RepID=A0A1F4VRN0_UNCKA|nr:MAG: hypothetical protein A3A70_00115 [candidate division WWE3 bacterium RIFCSPLOWO2_01_FULL_42_11]
MSSNFNIQILGENLARKHLEDLGYHVLEMNYRSKRWGEIDIVATDGDTLVFVEVKTRTGLIYGAPLEAITNHKVRKLMRTTQYYISFKKPQQGSYRFEAIGILLDPVTETVLQFDHVPMGTL